MKNVFAVFLTALILASCQKPEVAETPVAPFMWENATIYFLLTDRFMNGDTTNDFSFGRKQDGAPLRSFEGGDMRGLIKKLDEGYFTALGVNAIWMTPVFEQVKGYVDEGYGKNYGFHGYWMRDWTALDPNFGTEQDLAELIAKAHKQGIRMVFDVVMNHTGPVTELDSQWPDEWVRTGPRCVYQDYASTVTCTLVENLPDIKTESDEPVELPEFLIEKWRAEGRLDRELKELDAFFAKTGYPRASRYYIMKWLLDYVEAYGIDGFRVDTAKHTEEGIWAELYKWASEALKEWKANHPAEKPDDLDFYMVGEVYGYSIYNVNYTYDGGQEVNYYNHGFASLINFAFKGDVAKEPEELFSFYSGQLNGPLKGYTTLNYIASHDDGSVLDRERLRIKEFGTKLLLAPGGAQIYYGDELGRQLLDDQAEGDATLRTFMPWEKLEVDTTMQATLKHFQKLGQFRRNHPSIGAGVHQMLSMEPYVFQRTFVKEGYTDAVVITLDNVEEVAVGDVFKEGEQVTDFYSGESSEVKNGKVKFANASEIRLISR